MLNNNNKNNINKQLSAIYNNLENLILETTKDTVNALAAESLEICPLNTGELRESLEVKVAGTVVGKGNKNGKVEEKNPVLAGVLGQDINCQIAYKSNHAICHEWPMDTNWTTPGTQSKFLENPAYNFNYTQEFNKQLLKNKGNLK